MLLDPGGSYEFNGRRDTYPDIRLVYWAGGNPFHHHQDLNRLQRAWQKPETVIVHESWWTPTARHADIVLPATTTLERNDVGGSSRDPFMFAMHRAIDPVGEARNDFDIFRALAGRLGYEQAFTEGRDEMGWCQWVYDQVRASATAKGVALPGFQQFWAEGFVELPPPERDFVLFEDFRRDPERHPLKTPSGRIEIVVRRHRAASTMTDCPPHPAWFAARGMARQRHAPSAGRSIWSRISPAAGCTARWTRDRSRARQKIAGREPVRINPAGRGAARHRRRRHACACSTTAAPASPAAVVDADVMPGVAVMATGAWFDPADGRGRARAARQSQRAHARHRHLSRWRRAPSALTALVEIERWTRRRRRARVHAAGLDGSGVEHALASS